MEHVLLVDDEAVGSRALGNFLARRGYRVTTAYDGQEALMRCLSDPPDIVVTDMRMPLLGGAELLLALRGRFPGLAAVVVTGHSDEGAALPTDAVRVLAKPVDPRLVLVAMEALLTERAGT